MICDIFTLSPWLAAAMMPSWLVGEPPMMLSRIGREPMLWQVGSLAVVRPADRGRRSQFGPGRGRRGDRVVRKVGIGIALLLASSGVARAVQTESDEGTLCAAVLRVPQDQLDAVVDACSYVIRYTRDPGSKMRSLRYRGQAYLRLGQLQAAQGDLGQALQLAPDDKESLKARTRVLEGLGDLAGARADYQRLSELEPGTTAWRIRVQELGGTASAPPPPATTTAALPTELSAAEPASAPRTLVPTLPPPAQPSVDPQLQAELEQQKLVQKVQLALRELGYPIAAANGKIDAQTRVALDGAAPMIGAEPGQVPDARMLAALENAARERRLAAEAKQKDLNRRAQTALTDLGYDIGEIDGDIGQRSRAALGKWQGQPFSGQVSEVTVADLEASIATRRAAPSQRPETPSTAVVAALPPDADEPRVTTMPAPVAPPAQTTTPPKAVERAPAMPAPPPAAMTPIKPNERRVALVIGNSNYRSVRRLRNPRNDAEDMASALRTLGFDVVEGFDVDRNEMDDRSASFARKAKGADLAMVYYAGHGIQVDGVNYLIPVDAQLSDKQDLRRLVQLDQLTVDSSNAKKAIVVVDACRDNPLGSEAVTRGLVGVTGQGAAGGLAQPTFQPRGTLIAYVTQPNKVAEDGSGRNSPYVEALLRRINTPDIDVLRMFSMVTDDVAQETQNAQVPIFYSSLGSDPVVLVAAPAAPAGLRPADLTATERQAVQRSLQLFGFWNQPIDGSASDALRNAIRDYQRYYGAGEGANGLVSPRDLLQLYRSAELRKPREPLPSISFPDASFQADSKDTPEARRTLAEFYDPDFASAPNVSKDQQRALWSYQRAAEHGDEISAARVGLILSSAGRSDSDRQAGRKWLEQAAAAGEPNAALRLAELMLDDPNAATDKTRAIQLLQLAATDADLGGVATAQLRELGVTIAR